MSRRKLLATSCPKPKPAPPKKPQFSSIVGRRTHSEKIAASQRLRSTTPPKQKSRKPINWRNKKRHAREVLRANGSPERREWMKRQPSVVSGKGPCVGAHVKNGGGSRKADYRWIVPVTKDEHAEMHRGQGSFEWKYNIELEAAACRIEARWQEYSGQFLTIETEKSKSEGR